MFKRLRWKLTATYIGLVTISMLVLGIILMNLLDDYFYRTLKTRLETQALLASRLVVDNRDAGIPADMEDLAGNIYNDVGARVTIIDEQGNVLGDSAEIAAQMENHLHRPEVQEAKEKGVGVSTRYSHTLNMEMMYVAVPVTWNGERYGFMRLALPLTETKQAFLKLWSVILVGILLAFFCAAGIGFALAKRVTEPVERLTEFARCVSRGDFTCRARVNGSDEINELAGALNHMADTVEEKVRLVNEGKNRLEAVLASMISGVIFVNRKGHINLANPAAEQFLSFAAEDISGLPHDVLLKHPELSDAINKALKEQRVVEREIKINRLREMSLEVVISPIYSNVGEFNGVVVVLHDITERRKVERMRKDFVANVSHELKTPVTSIKGFTETLLDGAIEDRETCREFVEIIDSEADRLKRLIEDLLELSRIEAMQVKLKRVSVDVRTTVRNIVLKMQGQIEKAGLYLEFDLPLKPVTAEIDTGIVEQVLINLVDNAVKYTPAGGKIEIGVRDEGDDILVWVRDNGPGIPIEDVDRVFERFYRVDKTRSREKGGTGLGLSIVKHLIDIHGGTVGVDSKPGEGAKFFFTLPGK